MRLPSLCCAVLTLLISTTTFAQDLMPMAGGNMGNPMPKNVEDNRQVVLLTAEERSIVAAEMRQMLASVQGVTDGLSRGDMQAVIAAASESGMAMMQNLPSPIRMKFPAPFSQMGLATHRAFDQIAQEAKTIKDPAPVLKQLSGGIQNCIACHATYRFASPKSNNGM
ncbi:hypothetical protein [Thiobacillus sp.]|uniref:hypothetical protein n=1 Tax=Thiobacillus sp. TaxID=924 RepID=UPI0011D8D7FD|nr:hypothetical protein [Thiobacillus sp.]TXH73957.1 MAG: hypothetical protein E6Q82_11955 [Thiobacillus sp.]